MLMSLRPDKTAPKPSCQTLPVSPSIAVQDSEP